MSSSEAHPLVPTTNQVAEMLQSVEDGVDATYLPSIDLSFLFRVSLHREIPQFGNAFCKSYRSSQHAMGSCPYQKGLANDHGLLHPHRLEKT